MLTSLLTLNINNMTKNFKLQEFYCKDGTPVPLELQHNVVKLANNLQVLRDYLNKPIIINSAYRHPSYNKSIGGASNSQHLYAKASDIRVSGLTSKEVYDVIIQLIQQGKMHNGGLGLYPTFVHYDVRDTPVRF